MYTTVSICRTGSFKTFITQVSFLFVSLSLSIWHHTKP